MAEIICFASGAGGVGKTSLVLSLGKLLGSLNYKVAVVDLDPATHGASWFLEKKIEKQEKNGGIIIGEGFDFIPSCSLNPLTASAEFLSASYDKVILREKYDFVLLDTQSGINPASISALREADKIVFILKADPANVRATYRLASSAKKAIGKNFCLYNCLYPEEAQASSVLGLPRFINLMPLPFDREVELATKGYKFPPAETPFVWGLQIVAKQLLDLQGSSSSDVENVKKIVQQKLDDIEIKKRKTIKTAWRSFRSFVLFWLSQTFDGIGVETIYDLEEERRSYETLLHLI